MPVPAIIGLIGSVLGAVVSNALQQQGINDMNRYNSPGAMALRLQQAGFSPANVFSQGAPAGVQSLIGNYQNSIGSDAMAAVSASQQGELIKSQKQALESEAALKNAQTIQQILESDVFKKYADKEKQYQLANYVADIALKNANAGLAQAQTVTESSKQSLMSAQEQQALTQAGVNRTTIEHLITSIEKMESEIGLNNYDLLHLKPQQVATLRAQADSFVASARKLASEADLNEQQWEMINAAKQDLIDSMKLDDNVKLAEIFYKGQLLTNMQQELKNLKQKYALDEVQSQVTFWTAIADVVAKYERIIPGSKFVLNH